MNEHNKLDVPEDAIAQRSWHWHSTPETAANLQPSVLALVETVFAVGIYIWVAVNGYTLHLILGACIAPFLLLRTNESTELGLYGGKIVFKEIIDFFDNFFNYDSKIQEFFRFLLVFFLLCPIFAVVLVVIKFIATAISVIRSPLISLMAIPENWWRVIGCTDFYHPPEPLPGYLTKKEKALWQEIEVIVHPMAGLSKTCRVKPIDFFDWLTILLLVPMAFLCIAFPALLYRWSLKGISIIYLPLLWVVHITTGGSAESRMREIKDLSFHKLRRWLGALIILLVASKLLLIDLWSRFGDVWLATDPYGFVALFVAPSEIPRWQVASAINGALAWIMLFVAESALYRIHQTSTPINHGYVVAARCVWCLGGTLTLYTLSVLLYNVGTLQWSLIPIGENWFPWQPV